MKTIQIMGRKNSGKTTLMNHLIRSLSRRGFKVGSLKHSPHPHPVDKEGADSYQHRKAGANPAAFLTHDGLGIFYPPGNSEDEQKKRDESLLNVAYAGCDLLLVESFHGDYGPVIAILDKDEKFDSERHPSVLAFVTRTGVHPEYEAFTFEDEELINLIVRWINE